MDRKQLERWANMIISHGFSIKNVIEDPELADARAAEFIAVMVEDIRSNATFIEKIVVPAATETSLVSQ